MNSRLKLTVIRTTLLILIVSTIASPAFAQKNKHVEQQTLTAGDGWPIKITYYKHEGKRDTPAIILLHSQQGDSRVWTNGFADTLWKEGFAVIAVDLRKHGESKGETATGASLDVGDLRPDDYKRMIALDMGAVKKFLFKEHQAQNLNMRKTGIIAPEMSAPIALNFTRNDWNLVPYDDAPTPAMRTPRGQDIRALVLISPETSVPGVSSTAAIRDLRNPALNIAFLFCTGSKDVLDRGNTNKMYQQVKGRAKRAEERVYLQKYPYKLRGMALIGKKLKIESDIVTFMKKFLLELEDEWIDRRSRLER